MRSAFATVCLFRNGRPNRKILDSLTEYYTAVTVNNLQRHDSKVTYQFQLRVLWRLPPWGFSGILRRRTMKLLFALLALLALCVAALVFITVAVFVRVRKHRRELVDSETADKRSVLAANQEREHKA